MGAGPTPPRPTWTPDDTTPPAGWAEVVVGQDGVVLAGWTTVGDFYAYAPTERIVRECIDAIRLAHEHHTDPANNADVARVEHAMAAHALAAWHSASARTGLSDHAALTQHADTLTRWSERLRMALRGDLQGDEEWLSPNRQEPTP